MQKVLQKLGKETCILVLRPDEFLQAFYSVLGRLLRLAQKSYAQII